MDKQREYILNNWEKYDLTDTKEEFVELLNCLEAVGETIDSLHDAGFNHYDEFMDIVSLNGFENDRDVVEAVFAFCHFFTLEDFKGYLYEQLEEAKQDEENETNEIYKGMYLEMFYEDHFTDNNPDCQIIKTTDGYVKRVRY